MPRAIFSESELDDLLKSILSEGGCVEAEKLLETEHQHYSPIHPGGEGLQPHERFFMKKYAYEDFELHVPFFLAEGDTVVGSDLQFKRTSKFPAPFWNRNGRLMRKLTKLLRAKYSERGIEVRDEEYGGRQIHYRVSSDPSFWGASTPFEEWKSECSLYDEPHSSGMTDPSDTPIRNDFVLLRYRRRKSEPASGGH